jgi:sulfide:quinone oxidoreductase
VIVGSSFGGMTAALELRRRLGDRVEIVVLDPRERFTFIPSLVWVPFGLRDGDDVTFPLAPMYARRGIRFVNDAAEAIELERRVVVTASGEYPYDRLLIATGPRLAFEKVPGLGPHGGHTQSICTLEHALLARDAWQRFLAEPGPVVIGTAQGGSCFGASYEFLFNVRHRIEKAGLARQAPVTFVTAEPFLGHFGLGGVGDSRRAVERHFERLGIEAITNNVIREVGEGQMQLENGRTLPFAFSMIVPPFSGVDVVRQTDGLANEAGFIPFDAEFRHPQHREVFSAGVAVAIAPPAPTPVPAGVPKTGQMTEHMARIAAQNIAADLAGRPPKRLPLEDLGAICVLDAGNTGIFFKTDRVFANGTPAHVHMFGGQPAHWAKLAFEQYFLTSRRHGFARV